ncbi:MAG: sensor histidine kinase [SAR202 cluster bacterium]|nr:sensor histidine kinase [SAR202 cluster bacterium]
MASRTNSPLPAFAIFDDYRPTVAMAVAVRWVLLLAWFFLNNYRVEQDLNHSVLNLLGAVLAAVNGYMTWRIWRGRSITWRHACTLSATDLAVITAGLFLAGGISNDFYVFYYPALLGFSLMFPRRVSFAVVAVVAVLYTVMAFTVSPTLDLAQEDEKKLAVRLINMVGIVSAGALITSWERRRRREAVAAERQRAAENLELERRARQAEQAAAQERGRMAREIHDGIAQSLYMLSISLEACADLAAKGQAGLDQKLDSLSRLSRQALLDARHYIFDLTPQTSGSLSLAHTLERQAQEFQTVTGISATLTVTGDEYPLPAAMVMGLHRMVQESLSNVYKHAQARTVQVRLTFLPGELQLVIADDGQGFDPAQAKGGHGLKNLAERARELGARLEINSAPGRGTLVRLAAPVPERAEEHSRS